VKWSEWILSERGHGPHWRRVLHVDLGDVDLVWTAIAGRIQVDPVSRIRELGLYGLSCEVDMRLTIGPRTAPVRTAWHYAGPGWPPRLISAYPNL
jgi:hypothetical protein